MTRIPPALRWALAAGAALSLAGCASDKQNAGPCPGTFALHDASRVVEFRDPGVEAYQNVAFTAEIEGVRTFCRYVDDKPIEAQVELEIGFGRGPAAKARTHDYGLWLAVTRTDVAVLDKKKTAIHVEFPRDGDRVYVRRKIDDITIPRANKETSGSNFEILVGFDVTPQQLEFNRQGKRFTLESAQ